MKKLPTLETIENPNQKSDYIIFRDSYNKKAKTVKKAKTIKKKFHFFKIFS